MDMRREQESSEQKQTRNFYAIYYWVLGGLLALLLLGVTLSPKPTEVPPELQGVWKTTEAGHSDRTFEVSSITVSFGTGQGTVSTGLIRKFEIEPGTKETVYTIRYNGDEGEGTLWIRYDPVNKVLRFKNQPAVVWQKVSTD